MEFQVPQFIEREIKVVGPLTFKQALYIGSAGFLVFLLYVFLADQSFFLFFLLAALTTALGLALAFVQVQGRSLITLLANVFSFFASQKIYLWKKKMAAPQLRKTAPPGPPQKPLASSPKIIGGGRLQKLSTKLEIGAR